MIRPDSVLRNVAALILFVAALLFVYLYHIDKNDAEAQNGIDGVTDISSDDMYSDDYVFESEIESLLSGFSPSDGTGTVSTTYDGDVIELALANISFAGLTKEYSVSNKTVSVPVQIPDEVFGTYTTVMEEKETERPQLELYDGMYIVDRGFKLELYSCDGACISEDFKLAPTYLRDSFGRALFLSDDGEYYAVEAGELVKSEHTENGLKIDIEYEHTADFLSEETGFYAVTEDGAENSSAALANADGEILTDYEYTRIYAFSEGLAAALSPDGSLSYIDTEGNVVITGRKSYKSTSDRYVDRVYALPDTMGPESIGFLYFDGSAVLVREKTVDYVYKENTISDKTVALRPNGEKLSIPKDYNCVSSADGVVVVEKDGKYGAFSSDGYWVLQPIYDNIEPYYEGLAVVKKDGKCGVYDTLGNEVLPFVFENISPVSNGRFAAYAKEYGFVVFEKRTKK